MCCAARNSNQSSQHWDPKTQSKVTHQIILILRSKVTGYFFFNFYFSVAVINPECGVCWCLSPKAFCTIGTMTATFGVEAASQSASELGGTKPTSWLRENEDGPAIGQFNTILYLWVYIYWVYWGNHWWCLSSSFIPIPYQCSMEKEYQEYQSLLTEIADGPFTRQATLARNLIHFHI